MAKRYQIQQAGQTLRVALPPQSNSARPRPQKKLNPPVVKYLPANPDPLFDEALKILGEIEKQLDSTNIESHGNLDLKLLFKRYNLPGLRLLVADFNSFNKRFRQQVRQAQKEIRSARGLDNQDIL